MTHAYTLVFGRWLVAGTPVDEPYPCRCRMRRGACRMQDPGQVALILGNGWPACPCWMMEPHDGIPEGCCRLVKPFEQHVVQMVNTEGASEPVAVREVVMATDAGVIRLTVPAYVPVAPEEIPGYDMGEEVVPGYDLPAARERIRTHTCHCRTPWDGMTRGIGYHCPGCCTNWSSARVAEMHVTGVFSACREPTEIRDVDTGRPLLGVRMVDGFRVWGLAPTGS